MLKPIRDIVPHHFLLVPGIGSQGGSLTKVAEFGINEKVGLLVNASRSIIYAGTGRDFAIRAREEAKKLQVEMAHILEKQF